MRRLRPTHTHANKSLITIPPRTSLEGEITRSQGKSITVCVFNWPSHLPHVMDKCTNSLSLARFSFVSYALSPPCQTPWGEIPVVHVVGCSEWRANHFGISLPHRSQQHLVCGWSTHTHTHTTHSGTMQRPTHRQSEIESSMSSLVHSNRTIKNRNEEGGWTDTEGGNYKN